MATKQVPSTLPVLIIIVLAVVSLVQLLAPGLIHPGLMLFVIGVVFLVLYFVGWIREPLTLVTGWLLAGFGLSFFAISLAALVELSLPLILLGLGIAFVAIYVTSTVTQVEEIASRFWPLVPGALLLAMGVLLAMEGAVGRERLWGVLVPLIPSAVAIWYLFEWRRAAMGEAQQ
ncbi:MAG TPA: hypothetical protein ENO24_09865 [Chloroflexi bacterium]|nr:hypothetical protein [Chloroflexota bacterium]